jgi:hypothetical protein
VNDHGLEAALNRLPNFRSQALPRLRRIEQAAADLD